MACTMPRLSGQESVRMWSFDMFVVVEEVFVLVRMVVVVVVVVVMWKVLGG
jgi:hypothetical protein